MCGSAGFSDLPGRVENASERPPPLPQKEPALSRRPPRWGGRALARETSDAELFEGGTLFIDCLCGSEVGLASGFYRSLGLGRGRRADPELGVETSAEETLWSRSRTPALLCHQCSEVAPRWTAGGVCHSHQCLLHPQTHSRRVARSHRLQRARCPRQPPSSPARPGPCPRVLLLWGPVAPLSPQTAAPGRHRGASPPGVKGAAGPSGLRQTGLLWMNANESARR